MAAKTWTLTDQDKRVYLAELSVGPKDVGGSAAGYKVKKQTLQAGLSQGVDAVEIDNGKFRFVVLPTRGMGLWKGWLGDTHFGWQSPVKGPVHPAFVPLDDPSGLGWLDGFDEWLVRCGLQSNGAPEFNDDGLLKYPLHGKIANRPAHKVELAIDGDSGEIALVGVVDESRFHFQKLRLQTTVKTKVGEPGLRIIDEVTNLSGQPAEVQMLYHVNFGQPVLDPGAKVVLPVKTLVPRNDHAAEGVKTWDSYGNEEAGSTEQVYFIEPLADKQGMTQALLKNAHGTQGASLHYSTKRLNCFTLWKNTEAAADGYVTGLEPGTNFPNPRSFEGEQGRVVKLGPGEKVVFELAFQAHGDAKSVEQAEQAIQKLQSAAEPKIFETPQPGWTVI